MFAVAIIAVELGFAVWLHSVSLHRSRQSQAWNETFESWYSIHLLIAFPVALYFWGFKRSPTKRRRRKS
jgi:hypothetical protein